MNQKEINELRRRFRPEKSAISRVYGCYVNSSKEIVSDLDESLGMMPQEESEKYLSLLKKGLSGSLGKNLIDIVFSTQQSERLHRLTAAIPLGACSEREWLDAAQYLTGHDCASALEARNRLVR